MHPIKKLPSKILGGLRSQRSEEYRVIENRIPTDSRVIDIGCGTGTFLERDPKNRYGIDINPENIEYCRSLGLSANVGSALEIDQPNNSWDVALSNHVFQVFAPGQAIIAFSEMVRVVRPGGLVIISTLNNYKWFYEHPENARPYLPATFRRYAADRANETSPMWENMPRFHQEWIWLRHEPLLFLPPSIKGNPRTQMVMGFLNKLQYGLHITKPFKFDAYTIAFRVS